MPEDRRAGKRALRETELVTAAIQDKLAVLGPEPMLPGCEVIPIVLLTPEAVVPVPQSRVARVELEDVVPLGTSRQSRHLAHGRVPKQSLDLATVDLHFSKTLGLGVMRVNAKIPLRSREAEPQEVS